MLLELYARVMSKLANAAIKLVNKVYKKGLIDKQSRDEYYIDCLRKLMSVADSYDTFYAKCQLYRITNIAETICNIWKEES